ncbi:hypothetical protein SLA2020_180410 [Shorea laevis]
MLHLISSSFSSSSFLAGHKTTSKVFTKSAVAVALTTTLTISHGFQVNSSLQASLRLLLNPFTSTFKVKGLFASFPSRLGRENVILC